MFVVQPSRACVGIRLLLVATAVVAAAGMILTPISAAPEDQPGYRRLVELESTRTFSTELVVALAAKDTGLAGRAALALGRTGDPRAAGPLRNATGAQDVSLRALAVYGYGLLAAKGANQTTIVVTALRDRQAAVRIAAVDAAWRERAAQVPSADALSAGLLAMVHDDPEKTVRARAAAALSGWRGAADATGIAAGLAAAFGAEADATVRWHEAWALRRGFAAETPAATVSAGLRDPEELVRIQFADLVGRRPDPAGAAALRPLLADPSWRVREQAAESLAVLGGGKRTEHLGAIPAGIVTPAPVPANRETPLPRPAGLGPLAKPTAAQARLDLPLRPTTSALMDGPMPGPHPRVRIGTTQGPIVVRLYPEWAPLTVANFLNLVARGYYDGLRWYRVVPDFVAQTGGHLTGKPDDDVESAGYTLPAEENPLEQRSGVISMGLDYTSGPDAHAVRDSANVEFYLTISPQLHLDRDFTVFGEIESGFATLGRLTEADRMTRLDRLRDD